MQDLGLFLSILIGAVIGSAIVLCAYELGKRTAKCKVGYIPSDLEVRSFIMAKSLLADIHSAAIEDNKTEIYSVDGVHQYETYEIQFCVKAIDDLLKATTCNRKGF